MCADGTSSAMRAPSRAGKGTSMWVAFWVRAGTAVWYNARHRLRRNPMRNFVYPTADVEAAIRRQGLECRFHRDMGAWQVAVFARR